jgi:hypothetical protein
MIKVINSTFKDAFFFIQASRKREKLRWEIFLMAGHQSEQHLRRISVVIELKTDSHLNKWP